MTTAAMGSFGYQLGNCEADLTTDRLAWFLAGAYPGRSKRKRIAKEFGVSEDTAKGWLNGTAWPHTRHIVAMGRKWGANYIDFVFGGNILTPAEMERQTRAAEERHLEMLKEGEQERARGEIQISLEKVALALARENRRLRRHGSRLGDPPAAQAHSVTPGDDC